MDPGYSRCAAEVGPGMVSACACHALVEASACLRLALIVPAHWECWVPEASSR